MQNDFNTALEYIEKTFSGKDFENIMHGEDDIKKAAAVLNLEKIENKNTAELLINHLTNQSGPLREGVVRKAFKQLIERFENGSSNCNQTKRQVYLV